LPSATRKLQLECPACWGQGCSRCAGGYWHLEECPNKYVRDVLPEIEVIDWMLRGMPPVAGGSLDQTPWILKATKYFEHMLKRAE
tara:strand:+ start:217 stop:471 length:255 start_codon:yes stop_codon:yes gene_type:complete